MALALRTVKSRAFYLPSFYSLTPRLLSFSSQSLSITILFSLLQNFLVALLLSVGILSQSSAVHSRGVSYHQCVGGSPISLQSQS